MPACPKCGKITKSEETICTDCQSKLALEPNIAVETIVHQESIKSKTSAQSESKPHVDSGQGPQPAGDGALEENFKSDKIDHSEISKDRDMLGIEEDLITIEESPFDDFLEESRQSQTEAAEPLEKTSLEDESKQYIEGPVNPFAGEPIALNRATLPPLERSFDSTDKIYALPDEAVSCAEREKLISSLQSKIPKIMQQRQEGDEESSLKSDIAARNSDEKGSVPKPRPMAAKTVSTVEPRTEIHSVMKSTFAESSRPETVFVEGSKVWFPAGFKFRSGDKISYAGRSFAIAKRPTSKRKYMVLAAAAVIVLLMAAAILPSIAGSPSLGKLVGVVINTETRTIVPDAQVVINELGKRLYSDNNGLFEFSQIPKGDWSISASKPYFKTAGLSFSLPQGGTTVVTLNLEPSIPTATNARPQTTQVDNVQIIPIKNTSYGTLKIACNIADARVILDNEVLGSSDKSYSKVPVGKHKLVIVKEGYKEYTDSIRISTNNVTEIQIALESIQGGYNPAEISHEEYLGKADDLAAEGKWQEAIGNYTLALAKKPDGLAYSRRADAYIKTGQINLAEADLFKASHQYISQGQLSAAMDCLSKVLEISPGNANAYRERGFVLLRTGDYKSSLNDLNRAVKLDEKSFDNQLALGEALYITGNYQEALKFLKKARKLDESNARTYALSALTSMAMGNEKDARKYYKDFQNYATPVNVEEFTNDPGWRKLTQLVNAE